MITTEKPTLPKLQFGEGTFAYTDNGTITYKKYVELSDGSKVRKTVNSRSIVGCIDRMREVEEVLKTQETHKGCPGTLKNEVCYWLENVKKNQLKTQSYNRIQSVIRNNIFSWELINTQAHSITAKELQDHINKLNGGDAICQGSCQ